ncbi:hypothetical protein [Rhizobium sp. Rhizsp82]|jgi:DNA-binding transcriptional LysR family regulator|uniref:hypothetical protein n=1 Tax=Rhizobium sp. Rhizsp82 TaxID=3243057 RepID=UPI0039B39039
MTDEVCWLQHFPQWASHCSQHLVVGPAIRTGQLVPVLSDWDIATLVHAVYPANRHIAVKVRMFVSFLVNHLSGDPDLRREKS